MNEQNISLPNQSIKEIDVLWITAGLGCDGDTIAMTAATQPTLEEVLLGGIPGIPKVRLHNPFLSYENGEEFMELFYRAAEGKIEPYILVIEGSIPNEGNKAEGYWAAFGSNRETGHLLPRMSGSIVWRQKRGLWWPPAPAPLTAAFMPWREIPLVAWVWLIISGGNGNQRQTFPSFVCPDARSFQTTSWRRCCICFTSRQGVRR